MIIMETFDEHLAFPLISYYIEFLCIRWFRRHD